MKFKNLNLNEIRVQTENEMVAMYAKKFNVAEEVNEIDALSLIKF